MGDNKSLHNEINDAAERLLVVVGKALRDGFNALADLIDPRPEPTNQPTTDAATEPETQPDKSEGNDG